MGEQVAWETSIRYTELLSVCGVEPILLLAKSETPAQQLVKRKNVTDNRRLCEIKKHTLFLGCKRHVIGRWDRTDRRDEIVPE